MIGLKEQINVRVGSYVIEQVDIIARTFGMTRSEVMRQALTEFIMDFDKKVIKKPCNHR